MELRCAVIDDEPLARELIKNYIAKTPGLKLAGEYESASEAILFVSQSCFDILFLDISMPGMSGIEFGHSVPEATRIIYITAYDRYALEGFRVNALDYLLKPVSYADFTKAAAKAISWIAMRDSYSGQNSPSAGDCPRSRFISVKSTHRIFQLRLDNILYIEAKGDRVVFYRCEGEPVSSLMPMREVEELLPDDMFMRIQRSFIVNLDKVEIIERNRVVFGRTYIPISETKRDGFIKRLSDR